DSESCSDSTTCDVKAMYLALYGMAKFNYLDNGKMRLWAGLHGGMLNALTKSSSVLNESQISTQVYGFSLGGDFNIGRANYLTFTFDYGLFPKSDTVDANIMAFRAGYGWIL